MENDVEYQDACAAASRVVSVKPFFPVTEEEIAEARSWIKTCETCVCCAGGFRALQRSEPCTVRICKKHLES